MEYGFQLQDDSIIDIEASSEEEAKIRLVDLLEQMGYLECLGNVVSKSKRRLKNELERG